MAYLILFGSILGYSSYIYILQKWPASKAGTYAYVNPVVGVFLGAVFLGEPVSSNVYISAIIILGGVFLVQLSKTGKKIKQEPSENLDSNLKKFTRSIWEQLFHQQCYAGVNLKSLYSICKWSRGSLNNDLPDIFQAIIVLLSNW